MNKLDKLPDIVEETLGGLQADRALYTAKHAGRNRVKLFVGSEAAT